MDRSVAAGRARRVLLAAAAAALLAGCGLFEDKKTPPSPLPELQPGLAVGTTWRLSIGSSRGAFLQPAVVENALYAASAGGAVLRVEPASGNVVWRTEVGAAIAAGVGADGFTVAVATPRGEVIALDADGTVRWRAQVSSDVISPPLVGRGVVIVRSTDHRLSAFEADSGKLKGSIKVTVTQGEDGALSVGGTMWSRRERCDFTIVTLAGRSNFTSYGYLDREYFRVDEVSALRRAESALLARAIGGRHVALDLPEGPLRYRQGDWTLDWYRRHRDAVSGFIGHTSGPGELAEWAAAIRRVLAETSADEVWAPIGVGPHTDHELTRNAFLALLVEDPDLVRRLVTGMKRFVPVFASRGLQPVLLCSPTVRIHLRRILERFVTNLVVLAHNEITRDAKLTSLGLLELQHANETV